MGRVEAHDRNGLDCLEETIDTNMKFTGASGEVSDERRNTVMETGGKAVLVIKWQGTW